MMCNQQKGKEVCRVPEECKTTKYLYQQMLSTHRDVGQINKHTGLHLKLPRRQPSLK